MHTQLNVQTIFKKKHLLYLISRAATAYLLEDFYVHFNEIKVVDIACADYLIRIGLEHWARSQFAGARYNIMTRNLAESRNAALSTSREYPIVPLIEYVRSMMMGWFSSRRAVSGTNTSSVTPKVADLLTRNFTVSTGYDVRHIINAEFEVRDEGGQYYRVDLGRKSCSCKEFDTLHIPCTHVVSAAVHSGLKVETLVAEEYNNAYWAQAYGGSINPAHGAELVAETTVGDVGVKLLPPGTSRPPGRPRRSRILSAGKLRVMLQETH